MSREPRSGRYYINTPQKTDSRMQDKIYLCNNEEFREFGKASDVIEQFRLLLEEA
jgi:hypothetical protein